MVESVGKKLHQARLQRGLTIDEAAHATKLRPDKIAALENDDYSRFANNIYAKGFLQIYGRYLKVDVEDFARTLDNANPISISDYQYLSNAPAAKVESITVHREERRAPSLAPLLVFVFLGGLGLAGWWVYQNYERLNPPAPVAKTEEAKGTPSPNGSNPDAAFINDTPAPVPTPIPRATTPSPAGSPQVAALPPGAPISTPLPRMATPAPLTAATPAPGMLERDFVTPAPVATYDPSSRPAGVNEVLVATVKKTWVTVRRDDPKAAPIFDDFVYPNANPLKLKGARFFIEARDPAAVQITKNGLPFAYQSNGVPVQ